MTDTKSRFLVDQVVSPLRLSGFHPLSAHVHLIEKIIAGEVDYREAFFDCLYKIKQE